VRDAQDIRISAMRNTSHFQYPGIRTTKRTVCERSVRLWERSPFSYLTLKSAAYHSWCAFDTRGCLHLAAKHFDVLQMHISYISFFEISKWKIDIRRFLSCSPFHFSFFYLFFLLFFFCRRVRYYVNCDSVVENGNENSPVEKRKSAGQRYVEWFLRTVESVRGACAWRAFKICGYPGLVASLVDR